MTRGDKATLESACWARDTEWGKTGGMPGPCPRFSFTELSNTGEMCSPFPFSGWRGLGRESQKFPCLFVQSFGGL